jgi:ABC-type sugar transport system substrate-binding protein
MRFSTLAILVMALLPLAPAGVASAQAAASTVSAAPSTANGVLFPMYYYPNLRNVFIAPTAFDSCMVTQGTFTREEGDEFGAYTVKAGRFDQSNAKMQVQLDRLLDSNPPLNALFQKILDKFSTFKVCSLKARP